MTRVALPTIGRWFELIFGFVPALICFIWGSIGFLMVLFFFLKGEQFVNLGLAILALLGSIAAFGLLRAIWYQNQINHKKWYALMLCGGFIPLSVPIIAFFQSPNDYWQMPYTLVMVFYFAFMGITIKHIVVLARALEVQL